MAQQQRPVTELLREAAGRLRAVDTDTHAVLEAACRGWISADVAGRLLADRADRGEYLPLLENALPILEAAAALCTASLMSEDLRPEVAPAAGTRFAAHA
jgi:hypothetical protein